MKFIQSFISDGMSMNSLKPSINLEPESSLDSCIMKEASVDDCILSKEMHSQNNGEKELRLTEYDIKTVENATKKMFEQVDLNSSITNSESPMKKDSWNSEALYDNTSEKENMGESTDMRFDILSEDDDDSGSIHLKISDDENSVGDPEGNEQSDSYNQQPKNITEEDHSQNKRDLEEENSGEVEDSHQSTSNTSSEEVGTDTVTSEKDKTDLLNCSNEIEAKSPLGVESDREDSTEEFESMPSCSESQVSCDRNIDTMVSEAKSKPTSPETFSTKKGLDILETNLAINNEENSTENDHSGSQTCSQGKISECDSSSPKKLAASDAPFDCFTKKDSVKLLKEDSGISLSKSVDGASMEKEEEIILSDDAIDSDSCTDNLDVNGLEICDEPHKSEDEGEESCNENVEEETLCNKDVEEMEYEEKQIRSPESVEEDDTINDRKLDESEQIELKSPEEILVKDSPNEEKFLEILEYQPMQDDGEDLRESNSDKDVPSSEIEQKDQKVKNSVEPLESEMCSEEEIEKDNVPSLVLNDSKESDDSLPTVIEGYTIDSPETNSAQTGSSQHSVNNKDQVSDTKVGTKSDKDSSKKRELQRMDSSDSDGKNKNNTVDDVEDDVKLLSEVPIGRKTDTLPESCEAQSGRKRTSSNEENLVSCSKRTKVTITESDSNDCDILVCEKTTDSDLKTKCTEVDTKEKCDTKSKRLSSSVSDEVEVKKIRVMPETPNSEKEEKAKKINTDENLRPVKNDKTSDSKKDFDNSENLKLKSFLRYCTHEQLKTMTRSDLEEMVVAKICESIAERSQCGILREQVQSLQEKLKNWQKKALQLTKQVKDLNLVLKRYGSDLQSKGPSAIPVKITRSVGLQVQMPGSTNWHQEENSKRKAEKTSSSTSTPVSSSQSNTAKTTASSPASKSTSSAPKVSEGGDAPTANTTSSRQNNPQTIPKPILKVVPAKSPASTNSGSANTNKTTSKTPPSSVNNRSKSSSELQVIDLTDAEEKTKTNTNRVAPVSSAPVPTSAPVSVTTTTVANSVSAVTSMGLTNVNVGRSIRVVQHLGGASTPILTQSGANAVAGQRVAYFVPSTSVPVQQRQFVISNPSQVRPAGVVSMSQRTNSLPTIVLKPGQVVPVSSVSATGANIIRTSTINSSLQLSSPRGQPRPGQLIQRLPMNASPVQSTALSVVQSTGLSVSSVSQHPAPLPPVPSVPSNPSWKYPPPKPDLKISKVPNRNQQGIVLSWNMNVTSDYEEIASYQLFAYQEGSAPPSTQLWKKVGDVKALPLPMACTLTQFMEGHKYHFAVRAVDIHARYGPFSAPGHIVLTRN